MADIGILRARIEVDTEEFERTIRNAEERLRAAAQSSTAEQVRMTDTASDALTVSACLAVASCPAPIPRRNFLPWSWFARLTH